MIKLPVSASTLIKAHILLIFICNQPNAESVQRWQDQQGQWHFGDAAATHDRRSEPVIIHNPISIVQNDQPIKTMPAEKQRKNKRTNSKTTQTPHNTKAKQCEKMREKMDQQPSSRKAMSTRQDLISQYEKRCVIGNYYGG